MGNCILAANSNRVLRLVDSANGTVLQKLTMDAEVRRLKFDDTGLFLLAGTKIGTILVFQASDSRLEFKFKVPVAKVSVSCMTFVPASDGQPACLFVNTVDSTATIIDCLYGPTPGMLSNLSVRHRMLVPQTMLPLKNCYSPSGLGYLISAAEDTDVHIHPLGQGLNYKLRYHQTPVIAVSVNAQDTVLASGDEAGTIVFWRRVDF